MARKLYDMAVKTGTYTDSNGQTKNSWENVGSIWETETNNGISRYIRMKASFNTAGIDRQPNSTDIIISLFPPKEKNY